MKTNKFITLFLLVSSFQISTRAAISTPLKLKFLTANYCPLICQGKEPTGIMVDITKAVFEPLGHKVSFTFMPFKRATVEINSGKYDGFVGGDKTQVTKNLFPRFVTTPHHVVIYKNKDSKWKFKDINQLLSSRLAVVEGFKYGNKTLDDFFADKKNKNILKVPAQKHLSRLIDLLKKNRIDAFLEGELFLEYQLQNNPDRKMITPIRNKIGLFENYISIFPSHKYSKDLLSIINKRFIELHANGTLQRIYHKYGFKQNIQILEK